MSEVRIHQPHKVSAEEARVRVQNFEEMLRKYGVSTLWSGNQATLKGTGVSGSIAVQPNNVEIVVKLGMMARAFGVDPVRLEASIKKRLQAAFADGPAT